MIRELNLVNSDLILNSTRVLILVSKFESRKAFKLNANKIMLYDFYMKFPQTMIPKNFNISTEQDFNEFYSFFHSQPDREEYQLYIRYLISKKLVDRIIIGSDFCYRITEKGKEALIKLESRYSKELHKIANYIKQEVSKLSENNIEETILRMSLKGNRD
ncbi:TPA: ABC-three component system middle component 2 [Bacillus cereus]|uniref:ABC-three component system middle component 2 n=1 Tax=Bacillus sp. MB353a TaxID=1982041 RepID=UPI000B536DB1|nr:ABC-three component system middle component 2 [Bacillus sp. MB353a]OWW11573.1 hypothetical protein BUE63_04085 [Bacillus sp. MB353a]